MADVLETIKNMIRQGASSDEIVETLRTMGIVDEDARRMILLAERDMLRVLRNEVREIAADAFIEHADRMKKELTLEVNRTIDVQMKLTRKNLKDMVRKELNRYVSTVSRLEDRVSLLERKLYDIEAAVDNIESSLNVYRPRKSVKGFIFKYIFPTIGMALLAGAVVMSADKILATYLLAGGVFFILGGVIFGK